MQVGTIQELWRHPVKSLGGESVTAARLTQRGLLGDRCWAFVDAASGEIRSAKQLPGLLAFRARFAPGVEPVPESWGDAVAEVEILGADGACVGSRDPRAQSLISAALGEQLHLVPLARPDDGAHYRLRAPRSAQQIAAQMQLLPGEPMPDFSGTPPAMLAMLAEHATPPGSYTDAYPLHLLTTASLAALRERSGIDADRRRFRPNLVVDTGAGAAEFREFDWIGRRLRVGGAILSVESRTIRCAMPSRAQPHFGLLSEPRITPALVVHCRRHLGVNLRVEREGRVRTGDPVLLVD